MPRRWPALPVYCCVRVLSEPDHLVSVRDWVKVCCVYDVCRRADAGTLNYASGYTAER